MSRIPLDDILFPRPDKIWRRSDPTEPPLVAVIPAAVMQEIRMTAQVQAFRAAMLHARKNGERSTYSEEESFRQFKLAEQNLIESLSARYLVEHGRE